MLQELCFSKKHKRICFIDRDFVHYYIDLEQFQFAFCQVFRRTTKVNILNRFEMIKKLQGSCKQDCTNINQNAVL